ncbi:hypothetical protein F383_27552 [Gossypium arboreum]|uniref:Uncharacterized protein n=1 Tax=Gossypium arboreum TaxID=29729 RepID=A0A0B0MM81_GOSAR|nr:hypothetical protein F383_27552 [Gossypium arboreum]
MIEIIVFRHDSLS